jgi:hypothetical protein
MADREPVDLEDVLNPEQLEELDQAIRDDNVEAFRTFFESKEFPLLPEDHLYGLPLTFYVLDVRPIETNSPSNNIPERQISRNIFEFLLTNGADVNFLSLFTIAAEFSSQYEPATWVVPANTLYATLAMNAAVAGDLDLLKLLYRHGADLDIVVHTETFEPIANETALYLVQEKLRALNEMISIHQSQIKAVEKNTRLSLEQKAAYKTRDTQAINDNIKERIKLLRVVKWLGNITIEENIPSAVSKKQYAAFQNVVRKRVPLGRLEEKYMSSFLQKPAKFAVVPEHGLKRVNTSLFQEPPENGLKRVNTSLFQGGKTRCRRARKMRSRRRRN